jgi:rhamnogalacturonyl hydrolase YesR
MDVENLFNEIYTFSDNKLKRMDDLKTLFHICFENEKPELLEDVSFTAKYIMGLQRVIKKGTINPEINNLEQVKQDYTDNIKKSVEQIKEIIGLADVKVKNHFKDTYLELSQQSFQSLSELLEDLEWAKMYFNRQKRQKSD